MTTSHILGPSSQRVLSKRSIVFIKILHSETERGPSEREPSEHEPAEHFLSECNTSERDPS